MALKIRLRQQGCNNRAFFRLVVTDVRSPRDGKYVEAVGWYNPLEADVNKGLNIKEDRIEHWLNLGAQISEASKALIAKVAPNIIKKQIEKLQAKRAKASEARKAKRSAKA